MVASSCIEEGSERARAVTTRKIVPCRVELDHHDNANRQESEALRLIAWRVIPVHPTTAGVWSAGRGWSKGRDLTPRLSVIKDFGL